MIRPTLIVTIVFSLVLTKEVFSGGGDETLAFYLSKSDLVVLGVILNRKGPTYWEEGVPNYYTEFKVDEVLKGNDKLQGSMIKINIIRLQIREKYSYLDLIKEGGKRIIFLKKIPQDNPAWETADVWFGVQYPSSTMARAIKRLTKKQKNIEQ